MVPWRVEMALLNTQSVAAVAYAIEHLVTATASKTSPAVTVLGIPAAEEIAGECSLPRALRCLLVDASPYYVSGTLTRRL